MLIKYSRTHWEMIEGIFNLNLLVLLVIFAKYPPTTPPLAKKDLLVGGHYLILKFNPKEHSLV